MNPFYIVLIFPQSCPVLLVCVAVEGRYKLLIINKTQETEGE